VSFNLVNKSCYLLIASKSSSFAKVATFFGRGMVAFGRGRENEGKFLEYFLGHKARNA